MRRLLPPRPRVEEQFVEADYEIIDDRPPTAPGHPPPDKWEAADYLHLGTFASAISEGRPIWYRGRVFEAEDVAGWSWHAIMDGLVRCEFRLVRASQDYVDWLRLEMLGGDRP